MADSADFLVQLKNKVSGPAKKAKKDTDALTRSLGHMVDKQGRLRTLNGRYASSAAKAGRGMKAQGMGVMGLAKSMGALAVAYGAVKVGQLAFAGGMAVANSAIKSDSMIFTLDKLTHGKGAEKFDEIGKSAANFGLDIEKTRKSYADFLKLQFSDKEAKKMITLGADMQALGNSADDIQGIFRAIGQIRSKGRLQAEEMLQLAERGVSQELIMGSIAKNRGLIGEGEGLTMEARTKVQGLQKAGKVSAQEFMVSFEEAINKKLGQSEAGESAAEFASKTMSGGIAKAKQRAALGFETLSRKTGEGLSPGIHAAIEAFENFGDSPKGVKLLEQLGAGFEKFGKFLELALPLLVEVGGEFASGFGDSMNRNLLDVGASGDGLVEMLREAMPLVRTVGSIMGRAAGRIITMADAITTASAAVGSFTAKAQSLAGFGEGGMFEKGQDTSQGFIDGIFSMEGALQFAGKTAASAVTMGMSDVLLFGSPSKKMKQFGRWTGEGMQIGMDETMPDVGQDLPGRVAVGNAAAKTGKGLGGGSVQVGNVTIQVDGGSSPEQTAQATLRAFERNLGSVMGRMAGEAAV